MARKFPPFQVQTEENEASAFRSKVAETSHSCQQLSKDLGLKYEVNIYGLDDKQNIIIVLFILFHLLFPSLFSAFFISFIYFWFSKFPKLSWFELSSDKCYFQDVTGVTLIKKVEGLCSKLQSLSAEKDRRQAELSILQTEAERLSYQLQIVSSKLPPSTVPSLAQLEELRDQICLMKKDLVNPA